MVFDFSDAALQLPHHATYDSANLPEGVGVAPPSKDRSKELTAAIHRSLLSIKKGFES